jgi:hypothetical protein
MRKTYLLGLVLVAMLAFSAVSAVTASAEPALWAVDGVSVTSLVPVDTEGLLFLTDLKAPFVGSAEVHCEVGIVLDGSVGPEGEDEVTEVLLNGVKSELVTCKPIKGCEAGMEVDVLPLGLPWLTQLELMEVGGVTLILDKLLNNGTIEAGYAIDEGCLVLGIDTKDSCKGPTSADIENMPAELDVLAIYGEAVESEKTVCEVGGVGSGDVAGEGLTLLTGANEGLELSVIHP